MVELYCLMCGHTWHNSKVDACPECNCRDFLVNDSSEFGENNDDWSDGHYEGDFPSSLTINHVNDD